MLGAPDNAASSNAFCVCKLLGDLIDCEVACSLMFTTVLSLER